MKRYVVAFFLLCFCTSLAATATCQKKKASVLFDQGVAALKQNDYHEALSAFEEAYSLSPHWAVLAHIGNCHAKLDEPVKALRALEQYLRDGGAKIPQDERETAEALIKEQRRKVGVLVLSVRSGVRAEVDGQPIGTAPFDEIPLRMGQHRVKVIFAEDDIVERVVEIEGGEELVLKVAEEKRVVPAPPTAEETEREEEDEESVPRSEERQPEYQAEREEENAPQWEDDSRGEGSLAPFFVTIGATVVGLAGAGLGFGFFAHYQISENKYQKALDDFRSKDPEYAVYTYDETCVESEVDGKDQAYYCNTESDRRTFSKRADTWLIVGIVGSGVAVVSGVLAIVFYLNHHWFGGSSDEVANLSLTPVVGRRQSGLVLSLTF